MKTILLSYPRSGVSWLRYIVRTLKGLPRKSAHATDGPKDAVQKHHWLSVPQVKNLESEGAELICIVRNYKEAIVRHNEHHPDVDDDFKFSHSWSPSPTVEPAVSYLHPLVVYDNWIGQKLLVYYEDLMQEPDEQISRIAGFVGVNPNSFLDDYELHKASSILLYQTNGETSETQGERLQHHQNKMSGGDRARWDEYVRTHHMDIFDRYLGRYAE